MAITVTNQEFLEGLFGEFWERAPISYGENSWWVRPAGKNIKKAALDTSNYYTLSIFRLLNGKHFARQKSLFERQFVFMIDDIGTKLNEAVVRALMPEPTYILETSPGNFQWGYKLVDGVNTRALDALVEAIVGNRDINPSGRDPGMKGVTRVARLPVGSNNKESVLKKNGGKGWPHVLHLWEPSRAWTVAELAGVLGVDLSEKALEKFKDVGGTRRATAEEIGDDPLMRLFDLKGMLRETEPNDSGFVVVQCPWHAEHSDARDEAGYRPGGKGFQCHHGHCEDRTMADLRAWFEENTTDAERAQALGETFGAVPADDPALAAEKTYRAVVLKDKIEEKRRRTEAVEGEWCFITSLHMFGQVSTNEIMKPDTFNAISGFAPYGKSGDKSAAAIFINDGLGPICKNVAYEPGRPPLFKDEDDGRTVFNTWREHHVPAPAFDATDEDVKPWLDHLAFMIPDSVARTMFLNWAAFLFQYPGQKMNWAYLLIGGQGIGKDTLLRPIYELLGVGNCRSVTADDVQGQWSDWAENQAIFVEELPSYHKKDVYDKMKRYVALGVPHFWVNRKKIAQYPVRNIQNWFIFSNHEDALALEADDRRYFIYASPVARREPEYYSKLNKLFQTPRFAGLVRDWLQNRHDLSAFDPGAPPPMTKAKQRMMEDTRHPVESWLEGEFEDGGRFGHRKLIHPGEVLEAAEQRIGGAPMDVRKAITSTRVGRWLGRQGWTRMENNRRLPTFGRVRLWVAPKEPFALYDHMSNDLLESRYAKDAGIPIAVEGKGKDDKPF